MFKYVQRSTYKFKASKPRRNWLTENKKSVKAFREKSQKRKAENEFKPNDNEKEKDPTKAKSKMRRISSFDVSEILIKHNIKDTIEI